MTTREEVLALLEALGESRVAVARTLRKGGFRGGHHAETCPVARYLRAAGITRARVLAGGTAWHQDRVINPYPVTDFIRRFDKGRIARDLYKKESGT